jgi:SlyX protein
MSSNRDMTATPHSHGDDTEQRLMDLEIKASYAEDLLDSLNQLVARQQEQIDLLLREVSRLRQRGEPEPAPGGVRDPRDELPPHY